MKTFEGGERRETAQSEAVVEIEREKAEISRELALFRQGEGVLRRLESSDLPPDKKREWLDKFTQRTQKFANGIGRLAILMSIGMAGHFELTKESVTETVDEHGETVFAHSDPVTQHYLNYLTGKERLSEEESFEIVRQQWKVDRLKGKNLPPNYDTMSYAEFVKWYDSVRNKRDDAFNPFDHGKSSAEIAEDDVRSQMSYLQKQFSFDPDVYKAYWQMEKEVGAPNIRWMYEYTPTERAHYNGLTNTMYVHPWTIRDEVIAEASHAVQFRQKPVGSYLGSAKSLLRVTAKSVWELRSWRRVYDDTEYRRAGSIEHEAHQEIEPALARQIWERTKKNTIAKNE